MHVCFPFRCVAFTAIVVARILCAVFTSFAMFALLAAAALPYKRCVLRCFLLIFFLREVVRFGRIFFSATNHTKCFPLIHAMAHAHAIALAVPLCALACIHFAHKAFELDATFRVSVAIS